MQPRYSPSGREIAFTSDRGGGDNIWVIDRAERCDRAQITKEDFRLLNQADWTPDGNYIVARKHFTSARSLGAGEMWLYHRTGGGGLRRADDQGAHQAEGHQRARLLARRPLPLFLRRRDARRHVRIFEGRQRPDLRHPAPRPAEPATSKSFVTGPGGAIRPTPSPDGKTLAFIRRIRYKSTLMLMDLASGRITPLTDVLDRDMQETWAIHGVYPGMSWTPDNRSIVFWAGGRIKRVDVASGAVADIPFHVTGTRFVEDAVRQQKDDRAGQRST